MSSKTSKEFKIGTAGLVAIAVLYLGINFLKGINTLSKGKVYYVEFANAKELAKSSPVYADGYQVGIVRSIDYNYTNPGHVVVGVDVDADLRIPKGSSAELVSAMLGGCTMNLLLANNPRERVEEGDTIQGNNDKGLMAKAGEMLPQMESIVAHVDSLVLAMNMLVCNPDLPVILNNAALLTASLNRSTEQLNKLMQNDLPTVMKTYNQVGENAIAMTDKLNALQLERTVEELNSTLASLNATVARLNESDNSLGLLLNDTSLYQNLNATVRSADNLLIDLKEHPKRYVHFSLFGKKDK